MNQGQKINLDQPQILQAAKAGLQLLNTPGAVNVPGPMAVTGEVQILNALLTAIVQQQVVLVNAPEKAPAGDTPPGGDGDKVPELKKIEGGKE
jgi:hypothetical protein